MSTLLGPEVDPLVGGVVVSWVGLVRVWFGFGLSQRFFIGDETRYFLDRVRGASIRLRYVARVDRGRGASTGS
jgi:hypothetical protein